LFKVELTTGSGDVTIADVPNQAKLSSADVIPVDGYGVIEYAADADETDDAECQSETWRKTTYHISDQHLDDINKPLNLIPR
jgi:hypothetical protein